MTTQPTMQRRLGLGDAVVIGLGSMIGAALRRVRARGPDGRHRLPPLALLLAGLVAPDRAVLGPAGRAPVAVELRLTAGSAWGLAGILRRAALHHRQDRQLRPWPRRSRPAQPPAVWERLVAAAAALPSRPSTAWGEPAPHAPPRSWWLWSSPSWRSWRWPECSPGVSAGVAPFSSARPRVPTGCCRRPGLLFFAFAGYARIATTGEEAPRSRPHHPPRHRHRPQRRSRGLRRPRHAVARGRTDALAAPPPRRSRTSPGRRLGILTAPVVRLGAAAATLGALLAGITGIARTSWRWRARGPAPAPRRRLDAHHGGAAPAADRPRCGGRAAGRDGMSATSSASRPSRAAVLPRGEPQRVHPDR
ncbi:hypothetical protein QJS66_05225 [Kocuria rhizophila]|nr:hypothetical protein QJS66_05225 [Kocuria rhizophila]